jgi:hypothetical protein
MNKETWFSAIRAVLTLVGSYLIGKSVLGTAADSSIIEILVGSVLNVVSVVWSIVDKTATLEKLQTIIRQIITGVGGVMVAAGKLEPSKIELYVGAVLPVLTLLYSVLSRRKSDALASGKLTTETLKTSS